MITITKRFENFPFAHRQPNHEGHCRLIHGHNWAFEFTFARLNGEKFWCASAEELCKENPNGFIIDFGDLKWLKEWLCVAFDHSLVLNTEDVWYATLPVEFRKAFPATVLLVPNCGAEGLADFVANKVKVMLNARHPNVRLLKVTVFEDSKNSATYEL